MSDVIDWVAPAYESLMSFIGVADKCTSTYWEQFQL